MLASRLMKNTWIWVVFLAIGMNVVVSRQVTRTGLDTVRSMDDTYQQTAWNWLKQGIYSTGERTPEGQLQISFQRTPVYPALYAIAYAVTPTKETANQFM